MSQTEIIIIAAIFGFLAVLLIVILIVLIKNQNNFGKRLRKLEEITLNSENIYSSTSWINPLKSANWRQRGTGQIGEQEQNYISNDNKDFYGSNVGRLSSLAFQSATDYLQTSFPTQAGNLNPLEMVEGMGDLENLPDIGISAAEFAIGLPERPAFFPGASRVTNNPMFKDAKRIVDPSFQPNRNDRLRH